MAGDKEAGDPPSPSPSHPHLIAFVFPALSPAGVCSEISPIAPGMPKSPPGKRGWHRPAAPQLHPGYRHRAHGSARCPSPRALPLRLPQPSPSIPAFAAGANVGDEISFISSFTSCSPRALPARGPAAGGDSLGDEKAIAPGAGGASRAPLTQPNKWGEVKWGGATSHKPANTSPMGREDGNWGVFRVFHRNRGVGVEKRKLFRGVK